MKKTRFSLSVFSVVLAGSIAASAAAQETVSIKEATRKPRLDGQVIRIAPPGGDSKQRIVSAPAWGTTQVSYYRQGSNELFPSISTQPYDDDSNTTFTFHRFTVGASNALVGSHPHLPGGSLLTYVELDYCDTSLTADVVLNLYACDYLGNGCSVLTTVASSGDGGCGSANVDLTSLAYTVDNFLLELVPVVFTSAGDNTTSVAGIIYGYQLQLSPAPGVATFNDVPTSDFAFQYIEALAASEVTGGCQTGPPALYCPDNFVTRRQMAIFIAKALGLSWGGF